MDTQHLKQEFGLPAQLTLIFMVLAHPLAVARIAGVFQKAGLLDAAADPATTEMKLYLIFAALFFATVWVIKRQKMLMPCQQ